MTADTQDLLESFVRDGSESAFRVLVARYVDLVHSTAMRLVDGDRHRAEDVAQIVFADLARMANKLRGRTTLGGWLHRHTCFVARTVMRGERRRQARERQAVEMNALNEHSVLAPIAPILDEAIQELGADDRDAILLRFFERRNLRSVGEALGTNENVAQKRVARAVQELAVLLQRRGVALSGAALAGGLAAGAFKAAPAGLAATIAGSVFAPAGTTGSTGWAAAKLAALAKFKVALVGAIIVAGVVMMVVLQTHSRARMGAETRAAPMPAEEVKSAALESAGPASQMLATSPPDAQASEAPAARSARLNAQGRGAFTQPSPGTAASTALGSQPAPPQPLAARSESWIRIEGTATIHDWQVEGPIIGGFLEIGAGFPAGSGRSVQPGPVQARAEAIIPVRSLGSVEKNGKPYSDKMDELMYESLKDPHYPRIRYRLGGMFLKGAAQHNGILEYDFDSSGELAVAGVTNDISMPVLVRPLGNGKFRISGRTSFPMTSFGIAPPIPSTGLGLIKTGDDVKILFEWVVPGRKGSFTQTPNEKVPLQLNLPAAAFKVIPKDLPIGPDVEPLLDRPRPLMWVPPGLFNLAPHATLASSDRNANPETLAKITDGDQSASEQSIIFLRKGLQWVQMDFASPHEVFAVVIWHAHNAAKIYHDVIVQVADDPDFTENVHTIFNNDRNNTSGLGSGRDREYVETHEGKLINAGGVKGRSIRFYSKGSTESALNEYTEIEVYGRPAQ